MNPQNPAPIEPSSTPGTEPEFSLIDQRLATELTRLAKGIQPDPQFQAGLEQRLIHSGFPETPLAPVQPVKRSSLNAQTLVWAGLAVAVILALGWGIRNLLPSSTPISGGGVTSIAPLVNHPVATEAAPILLPIITLSPALATISEPTHAPTEVLDIHTSPFFPDGGLALKTELPSEPAEAILYRQLPLPDLTLENARQTAKQLGVDGEVYISHSDTSGGKYYTVTDGLARIDFMNSPDRFYYTANPFWFSEVKDLPPTETQVAISEKFLKDHGLLQGKYSAEVDLANPGAVNIVTSLEGYPLRMSLESPPQIRVRIGAEGKVLAVDANLIKFEQVGSYPITSSQAAFDKLISSQMEMGVDQSEQRATPPPTQFWQRAYDSGQEVELFGNLELLAAVEPGKAPFAALDGYPLKGDSSSLIQTNDRNTLFQVTGTMQRGEKGQLELWVKGWQVSPLRMEDHVGTILHENGQAYLQTGDQRYLLPDLPLDVPEGLELDVSGVTLTDPEPSIAWKTISTNTGGGGGGGSASGFKELNLTGSPTPVLTPTAIPPYQPGQKFEALQGTLYIVAFEQPDHSLKYDISIQVDPTTDWPDGLYAKLEGPGLAGIEKLNHHPVRIWGTFGDAQGFPPIWQVDRYEDVLPDATYQGWLGTIDQATKDGQTVTVFTTQSGEQYILGDSIDTDQEPQLGNPGDLLIVEGLLSPGDTFAGLPVIRQTTLNLASQYSDVAGYLEQLKKPNVLPASETGSFIIDKVELVYSTPDGQYAFQNNPALPLYAQPVWRFTGHTTGGLLAELQVQAISPDFLK